MSKQLCPECGKPLPAGSRDGTCPTCLLTLGISAARSDNPASISLGAPVSGDQIGRYKLLELIGEGGFGNVWMAEQLPRLLHGELDWIILKALDKDRARRYATANGFATDLRRYLSGETVTAAPPTVAYRFTKFARKNRIAIATGAAFVALLVVGIGATAWQAVEARNSARESGEQRDKAQAAQKTANLNAAETRRELYVARIRLAHQAWQEGNLEQTEKMLEATIPAAGQEDLRDFEWRYLRKLCQDESRLTFTNLNIEFIHWRATFQHWGRTDKHSSSRAATPFGGWICRSRVRYES